MNTSRQRTRLTLAPWKGALLIPLAVVALHGCGSSGGDSGGAVPRGVNQILLRTRVTLRDEDVAKLPADFLEKAATVGWQRVKGGFEKTGPGPNIKVTNGYKTVLTDDQGRFSLPGEPSKLKLVADENRNVLVPLTAGVAVAAESKSAGTTENSSDGAWVLTIPSKLGIAAGDAAPCCQDEAELCANPKLTTSSTSGQIRTSGEAMEGRCMDYNGWWSDGNNYGKNDWRAYRNFVMSDCDRAFFTGCWRDHYSGGCWNVHGPGGCSRQIGHSSDYHKHNFPR